MSSRYRFLQKRLIMLSTLWIYVITNFMEKWIGAEIKHMEDFRKTILISGRWN